ncbi:MAG: DUF4209 domain-containing protein [Proteobacteria bacterium]|nr:MAG: DUF4209 domain-containing protein [Pseudomonadota bacterium]
MKKIWRQSKADGANDHGVSFESAKFPQAFSIDDIVELIESSEVNDLLDHSFGRELGIATDGVPEIDRINAIFLVCVATSFQESSFDHKTRPWKLKDQLGGLVQFSTEKLVIDDKVRPIVLKYLPLSHNPLFRFRLELISFSNVPGPGLRSAVESCVASSIESARHLFRHASHNSQSAALNSLEVAAFLTSKYSGMIPSLLEITATIRFALFQQSTPPSVKIKIGEIILHFLKHARWRDAILTDSAIREIILELRADWVLSCVKLDFGRVEKIRDILIELYRAMNLGDLADEIWTHSRDILEICASKSPGAIASGIFERLLLDGHSRLSSTQRKELIKRRRESVRVIASSMSAIGFSSPRSCASTNLIQASQKFTTLSDKIDHLLSIQFMPSDEDIRKDLVEYAEKFTLMGRLSVGRVVGDRDDGGTINDPRFREREAKLRHLSFFMAEVGVAIVFEVYKDLQAINEYFKGSFGWDNAFIMQFDRFARGVFENDPMQVVTFGIAYLEGFLGRALDLIDVSVDKLRDAGAVIHRSTLEGLLDELEAIGFNGEEVELYRLILTDGGAGWNLRNLVYHGLAEDRFLDDVKAASCAYLLLKFAAIFRPKSQA